MKPPGSTKKHGGAREGAGRPKTVKHYSERVKKNWLAAAKKIAKETGMNIEEHLLRMLIDPATQDTSKVGIGKLYNEALLIKQSEQTIEDKRQGPTIGLPPIMPKPEQDIKFEEKRVHQGGFMNHDHRNQCCEHESINYIASHKKFCCNICGKMWRGNLCNPSNPLPSDLKDLEEILDSNPAIYKRGNFGEYCP